MKIVPKFIEIPLTLWENTDLTWIEKISLVAIYAVTSDPLGVRMSPGLLASMLNIPKDVAKDTLNSLYKRNALVLSVDEDGAQRTAALPFKTEYPMSGEKKMVVADSKPRQTYDYEFIAQQWNEINPQLAPIGRFTPKRKKMVRTCLTENGASVDALIKAFKIISISEFLNGRKTDWSASFDWLIKKSENLDKVLSGNYCNSYQEKQRYQQIIQTGNTVTVNEDEEVYK
jgi:hypothetical protein